MVLPLTANLSDTDDFLDPVTVIIVNQNALVETEGYVYRSVQKANNYCQSNPNGGPYVIQISAGTYYIEETIICNNVPVVFRGEGRESTILNFDRTNESSNYWLRRSGSGLTYESRICFGFCEYTDQGSYGVPTEADWFGYWGVQNLKIEMEYRGDSSTPLYMSGIWAEGYENRITNFKISFVKFQTVGAPVQAETDSGVHHYFIRVTNSADSEGSGEDNEAKNYPIIEDVQFIGDKTLSGTITVSNGSTSLTGTDTNFTEELNESGYIHIGQEHYAIASITDDTTATLARNAEGDFTDAIASAVNPFEVGLRLNFNFTSLTPSVTIRDIDASYSFQHVIHAYRSSKFNVKNIYAYCCGLVMKGGALTADDSVIFLDGTGIACIDSVELHLEDYLNDVWTDQVSNAIGIGEYTGLANINNIKIENNSNTFSYYHIFYLRSKFNLNNISIKNYTYDNQSIYMRDSSDLNGSTINGFIDEVVTRDSFVVPANVDSIKITNSEFEEAPEINGDQCFLSGIKTESGSTLIINGERTRVIGSYFWGDIQLQNGSDESILQGNFVDGSIYGTSGDELSITGNRVFNKGAEGVLSIGSQSILNNNYWQFHDDTQLKINNYTTVKGNDFYIRSSSSIDDHFDFSTAGLSVFDGNTVQSTTTLDKRIMTANASMRITNNIFENFQITSKYLIVLSSSGHINLSGNKFDGTSGTGIIYVDSNHNQICENNFECSDSLLVEVHANELGTILSNNNAEVAGGPTDVFKIAGDDGVIVGNVINNQDGGSVGDYFDVSGDYNVIDSNVVRSRGNGTLINDTGTGNSSPNNINDTRS